MNQVSAALRKDVRAAEKRAEIEERNRGAVVRRLMADAYGRKWVWDRLAAGGLFDSSFYPDPYQAAYRQGERNQANLLLADVIRFCPHEYIQAIEEANDRASTERTLTDNAVAQRTDDPNDPLKRYAAERDADDAAATELAGAYRHPDDDPGNIAS